MSDIHANSSSGETRNTAATLKSIFLVFGFWFFRHFLIQKIAIWSIGCKRSRLFTLVELERMPKPQYGLVFYPAAVCRLYIETHDRVRYINQSLVSGLPMVFLQNLLSEFVAFLPNWGPSWGFFKHVFRETTSKSAL